MPDDSVWICCRSCGKGKLYCKLSFGIEAYVASGLPTTRHAALVSFVNDHLHCGIDASEAQLIEKSGAGSLVAYQFNRNIGLYTERALEWIGDDPEGGSACRLKKEARQP